MIYHLPVMKKEIGEFLINDEKGVYVDCTLGGGGHSEYLLERFGGISIIGIDRDDEAVKFASERLARFGDRARIIKGNFKDVNGMIDKASGFLMDLGISSHQIDEPSRGFSFRSQNLDMRMDRDCAVSAEDLVNTCPEEELAGIFYEFGEERRSRQIAKAIVEERAKSKIVSAARLAEIVGRAKKAHGRISPATLVFQALRIAVNGELENLAAALSAMPGMLSRGGRIVTLSYHSLEDRIIKNLFKEKTREGILKILTKKVVCAPLEEQKENPRSRSAKLRCAERI